MWDCFDAFEVWSNFIQCWFRLDDSLEHRSKEPMCNLHKNFISVYGVKLRRSIFPLPVWNQRLTLNACHYRPNTPKKLKRLHNSSLSANDYYWKTKRLIVLGPIHYKREPSWKRINWGQSELTSHSWNPKCLTAKSATLVKWQSANFRRPISGSRWIPLNFNRQTSLSRFPIAIF